ncbi:hypothetical protein [Salinarimonas sp.]
MRVRENLFDSSLPDAVYGRAALTACCARLALLACVLAALAIG